jgi:hypothetical protein
MRIIPLSSPNHFRARCGPGNDKVYACTQFVGPKLAAQCAEVDGGWSIRPSATYTALIYIFKSDYLGHERLHERDMARAVDTYLQSLETRTFGSDHECEDAAKNESEMFVSLMRKFAGQSNLERGCTPRHTR